MVVATVSASKMTAGSVYFRNKMLVWCAGLGCVWLKRIL